MKKNVFLVLAMLMSISGWAQTESSSSLPRWGADEIASSDYAKSLSTAIDAFYDATQKVKSPTEHINLHSIMVVKGGKVVAERWYNGASAEKPHQLWSVSKTFTATAAGLAISEGKLKLRDKVIKFFPDKLPETISDNLAKMTVWDLLTMTCGHDTEIDMIWGKDTNRDWVKAFLAHPVIHKPGTYFMYNSLGTYMVSAILQKVTGQKVNDYLDSRLWKPLGIDKPVWDESPQGINCGGWGLNLKTEDLAKMGLLLLHKGKWNGKRVIPSKWVKEMSSYKVPSCPAGTRIETLDSIGMNGSNNDWCHGYCYQMWRCKDNGYRADGANGQYIMVFPDRDVVLVLTTDSNQYQPYMNIIWKYLIPALLK